MFVLLKLELISISHLLKENIQNEIDEKKKHFFFFWTSAPATLYWLDAIQVSGQKRLHLLFPRPVCCARPDDCLLFGPFRNSVSLHDQHAGGSSRTWQDEGEERPPNSTLRKGESKTHLYSLNGPWNCIYCFLIDFTWCHSKRAACHLYGLRIFKAAF